MKAEEIPTLEERISKAKSLLRDLDTVVAFVDLVREPDNDLRIETLDSENVTLTAVRRNGEECEVTLPVQLRSHIAEFLKEYRDNIADQLDEV